MRLEHPVFTDDETVETMTGRLRLSPTLSWATKRRDWDTATFVLMDKKIIHGMKDGVPMPVGLCFNLRFVHRKGIRLLRSI